MFTPEQELFIKICGITNLTDAELACNLGVNAIGFNFSESSRYYIEPKRANLIIEKIPEFISKIGEFSINDDIKYVRSILKKVKLSAVQIEGNYAPDDLVDFDVSIIKVFLVDDTFDVEIIKNFLVDAFLLKNKVDVLDNKPKKFYWDVAIKAKEFGRVILSGGLNPDNIESAVRYVQPYGVDVCEGIEYLLGKKHPVMMRQFIARARNIQIDYRLDNEKLEYE